jgi:hypothetical protein
MIQEYEEEGNVVVGQVMDQTKCTFEFCNKLHEMHVMTVEYNIGESTYCKKFCLTQNDDIK